jgi:uncharacterized protein (TIGR02466 family)|tara:strand:+ start:684 stop:1253 length:570 start_codon:yes stop_codon:yes gene_type:complete
MITLQDTKLFIKNYAEHAALNEKLKKEILDVRSKEPEGLPGDNSNCWRSIHKYECEQELLKPINLILEEYKKDYLKKPASGKIIYWTNINEFGGGNLFHTHYRADCDLSGVYYVQGKDTGSIKFATHEQMYFMIPPHMPYAQMIAHEPNDGDILLFPSYLLHEVTINTSAKKRITIGFNIKLDLQDRPK